MQTCLEWAYLWQFALNSGKCWHPARQRSVGINSLAVEGERKGTPGNLDRVNGLGNCEDNKGDKTFAREILAKFTREKEAKKKGAKKLASRETKKEKVS